MSGADLELSEKEYRFDNDAARQQEHRKVMRALKCLIMINILIFIILLVGFICGLYAYNTQVGRINKLIDDGQDIYKDVKPFIPQLGSLFEFAQQATQFIKWAEACVKAYGFCSAQ